ncbi:hypothetical protein MMC06_001814, partial [Schaereria dolodes]|nr:hypothetical protein [Schaereria dolodes]
MAILKEAAVTAQQSLQDKAALDRAWNFIMVRAGKRATSTRAMSVESLYFEFGSIAYELRSQQCKDDHDHIFAILGLMPADRRIRTKVDYNVSVTELYVSFAREHLRYNDIDVLYFSELYRRRDESSEQQREGLSNRPEYLPSWAPEYRESKLRDLWLPWNSNFFNTSLYFAAEIHLSEENTHKIFVRGFLIDIINEQVVSAESTESLDFAELWRLIVTCKATFDKSRPAGDYPTGEDPISAFARTIVADGAGGILQRLLTDQRSLGPEKLLELWRSFEEHCVDPNGELCLYISFLKWQKKHRDSSSTHS